MAGGRSKTAGRGAQGLDITNREARARRKAERDAKATSTEPAAQDDQASTEVAGEEDLRSDSKAERVPKQVQTTESAQTSEGGADVGESPAADLVSDSPQPEQDVETAEDMPDKIEVIKVEDSDAEVRSSRGGADAPSRPPQISTTPAPSSSQSQFLGPEVLPRGATPVPTTRSSDAAPSSSASGDKTQLGETAAKNFVSAERCPRLDRRCHSSKHHVLERMCGCVGDSPLRSWFRVRQRCSRMVHDHASKIDAVHVRAVVEEIQQLVTGELIEWKQLSAEAPFKVVQALSAEPVFKQEESKDNSTQTAKGDLLMEDYEVELFGQAFVSQCRMTGILELRSPRGPPETEPDPKRPQHRPDRPLSISTPSDHSWIPSSDASFNAQAMSIQGSTLNASFSGVSDSVPSASGPSGTSTFSAYQLFAPDADVKG
ncbi:hypothetical protein ON010_g18018 [Phytophthora cinnamomi]|nr:hypothetical protein ON010_g18018 [Phytophthora cinnamomi]